MWHGFEQMSDLTGVWWTSVVVSVVGVCTG